jgi:phosphohistidine phosphatase SixA
MRIYLMRHAEAVEPGEWSGPDRTRPLTAMGEARLSAAIEHMRRLRLSADVVLTSPYERAVQTAHLIAEKIHILQTIPCKELAAGARFEAFQGLLKAHARESAVWIVAHMPEIAVFASRITGDAESLDRPFLPAEIVAADVDPLSGPPGGGRILWRRRIEDWPAVSG